MNPYSPPPHPATLSEAQSHGIGGSSYNPYLQEDMVSRQRNRRTGNHGPDSDAPNGMLQGEGAPDILGMPLSRDIGKERERLLDDPGFDRVCCLGTLRAPRAHNGIGLTAPKPSFQTSRGSYTSRKVFEEIAREKRVSLVVAVTLTVLAGVVRFWGIAWPSQVV